MIQKSAIPAHATCVFKGDIFEVWQWEQKMYDGTTKMFERIRRQNTVQIIAIYGKKIVILEEEQPDYESSYISFPGGRVEKDEEASFAAQRELMEETGLASIDWELWSENRPESKLDWSVYTYIARNVQKMREPSLDSGEKIKIKYLTFEQLLLLPDEKKFRGGSLEIELLRARYDKKARTKLKKALFKK